ncbi:MAG TPA: DUF6168 family protein [Salinimicrobium sp.]|nr:DUF6168 family protein [Salinimicrobium sp.]
MKTSIFSFLIKFIPFSLLLMLVQLAVVRFVLNEIELYYSTYSIYTFHIISTLLVCVFLIFVHQNLQEKTGFAFMGSSLLKMLAAVLFLFPLISSKAPNAFENIMLFFVPYFLFLIFETLFAVRLLNRK